jgi:hypothetical protein
MVSYCLQPVLGEDQATGKYVSLQRSSLDMRATPFMETIGMINDLHIFFWVEVQDQTTIVIIIMLRWTTPSQIFGLFLIFLALLAYLNEDNVSLALVSDGLTHAINSV